jgi:uncharacterized protein YkwD
MARYLYQISRIAFAGILLLSVSALVVQAQFPGTSAELAKSINRERLSRGLAPLALNSKLNSAAQGLADDIAQTKNFGHIGSDGSTVVDRIARAGYGKYSWGYRVGENWAWFHDVASAMAMWMDSAPHRSNILHPLYREIGIGVAPTTAGGFIYVIDFGAQPNVLPIFINDGATQVSSHDVKITLTDEQVAPTGEGNETIGHAAQVLLSNSDDFVGSWQPFATSINWTLAPGSGTKTVYVRYRDAKGRTTTASSSVVLVTTSLPTKSLEPTIQPTRRSTSVNLVASPIVSITATPIETVFPMPTIMATMRKPIETSAIISTPTILSPSMAAAISVITLTATPPLTATGTLSVPFLSTSSVPTSVNAQNTSLDLMLLGTAGFLAMLGVFLLVKYLAGRWPLP